MARPSDKESFRALARYFVGLLVGQAVGRSLAQHPVSQATAIDGPWLQQVREESEGMITLAIAQLGEDLNDDVVQYIREHAARVLTTAPKMRKALDDHVRQIGGLNTIMDFKEALNSGAALAAKMRQEGVEE